MQFNQVYTGVIIDDNDPLKAGRYKIIIPELMQQGNNQFNGDIWVVNSLNTFTRFRTKQNQEVQSGSYFPLRIGLSVQVKRDKNGFKIIAINPGITNIPDPDNKKLRIIDRAPDGSIILIDEENKYIQISREHGKSNLMIFNDRIDLDIQKEGTPASSLSVHETGIDIITPECTFNITKSGIGFGIKGGSYFKMTKNSIELFAPDSIHLSSKKTAQILSGVVNINGIQEMNLRSSDTKITGSQKLSLTGSQIVINSFLGLFLSSTYIKIGSKIKTTIKSIMLDINTQGIRNDYSTVHNSTSKVLCTSANMHSELNSTKVQDGTLISNMGVATSVNNSLDTSITTSMQAIDTSLQIFGTNFLMNNPVTVAGSNIITDTLSGVASPADEPLGTSFGVQYQSTNNPIGILNNKRNQIDNFYLGHTTISNSLRGDTNGWI